MFSSLRPLFLVTFILGACGSASEEPVAEIPCGEVRGGPSDFSLANSDVDGAQVGAPSACEAGVDIPVTRSAGAHAMEDVVNERAVNVRAALAGAGAEVYGYGNGSCSSQVAVIIDDWGQADNAVRGLARFMSERGVSGTVNVTVEANSCVELEAAE